MIGHLRGTVLERDATLGKVLLDVGGVGYELNVSLQTLAEVPDVGGEASFWVHTHVREDLIALYGFASARERELYRMLTSVPKVGPRNAIATLGGLVCDDLIDAVAEGQIDKLTKIPGIGKKTAEQMTLTLRDKVEALRLELPSRSAKAATKSDAVGENEHSEVHEVLIALGWKPKQVERALDRLLAEQPELAEESLDTLVRKTLAKLMN